MRKLILPIALAATGFAMAADIEIHGNVDFDFASYFNRDFDPTNAANQDIDLSVTANLDENVSVTVFTNTKSNITNSDQAAEIRHGLARSTAINSDADRYTAFNFDGVELRWTPFQDVSFIFGDLCYNAGTFNYYFWRDASRYAVITRDQNVRGLGVEVAVVAASAGAREEGEDEGGDFGIVGGFAGGPAKASSTLAPPRTARALSQLSQATPLSS